MLEGRPRQLVGLRPRPDSLFVTQSRTVLMTDRAGFIHADTDRGLYVHETRLLSHYEYRIDGRTPIAVALSNVDQHSWLGYYIASTPAEFSKSSPGSRDVSQSSEHTIELRVSRFVGEGLHEDLDFANHNQRPVRFRFDIELDADFLDQQETKQKRIQHGMLKRRWRQHHGGWELIFDYRAEHQYRNQSERGFAALHRGLIVRIGNVDSPPTRHHNRVSFDIALAPHGTWHGCLNFIAMIDDVILPLHYGCGSFHHAKPSAYDRERIQFIAGATQFNTRESQTLAPIVSATVGQAVRDLASLRLHDLDQSASAWTVAAGVPVYVALFGRDTLSVAWQSGLVSSKILRGTLPAIAQLQGSQVNDWRDEQPDKMLHEAHTGPLAALNYNPRLRYYGSITTSAFFPVAVANLWNWTGDRNLVAPLIDPALRSLNWLEQYGDLDGDGFHEYLSRSDQGVKNQAWKDSEDAIVYDDGSQVEPPIATCEEQGFAYAAKRHFAEVLWDFGERDLARRLVREADEYKQRFNEAFWMEDQGYFAMGLDSEKRQIKSIASNPTQCIVTGIADTSLVQRTVDRLFANDLFSGWGIRTLSAQHPAYNPFSYHRGSVWPVEFGPLALGLYRFGLHDRLHQITQSLFECASLFDFFRLPECFSGHPRDEDHPFPAFYPRANSPQAWSASSVICAIQALLGLFPIAPHHMLVIDPQLPEWLPELRVDNLHVGDAILSISFHRDHDGTTDYEILEHYGKINVVRQPSPWSLTASVGRRAKHLLTSLLPGQ